MSLLGISVTFGLLFAGVTNASAHMFCSVDPTLGIGIPASWAINVTVLGSNLYAHGDSHSTTFGGSLGLEL